MSTSLMQRVSRACAGAAVLVTVAALLLSWLPLEVARFLTRMTVGWMLWAAVAAYPLWRGYRRGFLALLGWLVLGWGSHALFYRMPDVVRDRAHLTTLWPESLIWTLVPILTVAVAGLLVHDRYRGVSPS